MCSTAQYCQGKQKKSEQLSNGSLTFKQAEFKACHEEGVQADIRVSSLLNDTAQATEQPGIASSSLVIHIQAIQVRQIDQPIRVHTVSRGIAENQVDQFQQKVPQNEG